MIDHQWDHFGTILLPFATQEPTKTRIITRAVEKHSKRVLSFVSQSDLLWHFEPTLTTTFWVPFTQGHKFTLYQLAR